MKTSENEGSFKKLISFILALVMLLSCLVSCGGMGTSPDDGTVPDTDVPADDGGDGRVRVCLRGTDEQSRLFAG